MLCHCFYYTPFRLLNIVAIMTTAGNVTYLPFRFCTDVTPQCPVEHSIYGYYPSIGANAFFVAFFLVSLPVLSPSKSHPSHTIYAPPSLNVPIHF